MAIQVELFNVYELVCLSVMIRDSDIIIRSSAKQSGEIWERSLAVSLNVISTKVTAEKVDRSDWDPNWIPSVDCILPCVMCGRLVDKLLWEPKRTCLVYFFFMWMVFLIMDGDYGGSFPFRFSLAFLTSTSRICNSAISNEAKVVLFSFLVSLLAFNRNSLDGWR